MPKTAGEMVPGQRYRGWGFVNKYKEFCFEPENTGANAGRIEQLCVREGVKVSLTKNNVLIHVKLERLNDKATMVKSLAKVYNTLVQIFSEYEI